jgi:hypothetical protein
MRSGFFSSRAWLSSTGRAMRALEMLDQRARQASRVSGVAERVELERHPRDAELFSSCAPEGDDLDVGLRLGGADDLGVELVELAEAALLRPLVAEGGPWVATFSGANAAASLRTDRRGRCRR